MIPGNTETDRETERKFLPILINLRTISCDTPRLILIAASHNNHDTRTEPGIELLFMIKAPDRQDESHSLTHLFWLNRITLLVSICVCVWSTMFFIVNDFHVWAEQTSERASERIVASKREIMSPFTRERQRGIEMNGWKDGNGNRKSARVVVSLFGRREKAIIYLWLAGWLAGTKGSL